MAKDRIISYADEFISEADRPHFVALVSALALTYRTLAEAKDNAETVLEVLFDEISSTLNAPLKGQR